jgi:hypothetical protein
MSTGWRSCRRSSDYASLNGMESKRLLVSTTHALTACRTTHPIVDSEDRIIGLLASRPQSAADWEVLCKEAADAIEDARARCVFTVKQVDHRRGAFPAVPVGISHGNGTQVSPGSAPQRQANQPPHRPRATSATEITQRSCLTFWERDASSALLALPKVSAPLQCEGAGCLFLADAFQVYFPKVHDHYEKTLDELIERDPTLRRLFPRTPFAAASVNFGPKTECCPHRDWANFSCGQCTIASLGDYDPDEGGHLAFWDLGIVVRFPPGSVILLPSALVRHSNTPIASHERRYSFAQYTSGGLFRWAWNGFKLNPRNFVESSEVQQKRWLDSVGLFSKLSEL